MKANSDTSRLLMSRNKEALGNIDNNYLESEDVLGLQANL